MPDEIDYTRLRPANKQISFVSTRVISALILREMSGSNGRAIGGYFWAVAEPVLGIALLSALFSFGFRHPPIGTNFAIFYATGLLPFFMFFDISNKVAQSLNFSKALLGYRRVTFFDAIVARTILATLTQLLVGAFVFSGILLLFDTRMLLDIPSLLLSYAMAVALAMSIGTMNAVIMAFLPAWQRVWGVLPRPLLIVSGVVIIPQNVPQPFRDYLWYNPLVHVTGQMRGAFYYTYNTDYVSPLYVFGLCIAIGALSMLFLRRYHRDILEF